MCRDVYFAESIIRAQCCGVCKDFRPAACIEMKEKVRMTNFTSKLPCSARHRQTVKLNNFTLFLLIFFVLMNRISSNLMLRFMISFLPDAFNSTKHYITIFSVSLCNERKNINIETQKFFCPHLNNCQLAVFNFCLFLEAIYKSS
jgi:hypothetical protein